MQNDANNETEVSTTGETPVVETNKQEQPAEAQAPVNAPESSTGQTAASTASALETPAGDQPAAAPERTEPRRVAKPPAPPQEIAEEKSGEIDFGKILEQFEQEQTVYHAGDLVEGKVVGVSERGALVDFGYKRAHRAMIPSTSAIPSRL
jgi:hypothetical protein